MTREELNSAPPKLLALAIAAWHEDNVLEAVVENMIESVQYPRSMYHVFLGVYPNDDATIAVAEHLSGKYSNVHVIINELPGPTSKAQNLNHVIRQIHQFELRRGWEFQALIVHDSEDVIHPEELPAANCLLDSYPAIQFPVFPLMEMPTFKNFFKNITTNTYADEFAENHFTTMVNRRSMHAFVPSAGTGFVLSRRVIESFGGEDVLPRDCLTEDYRLALTLFEKGIPLYYALEKLPRLRDDGKIHWDYIATRSRFPDTYRAAVKQKTRWILGITMQSFRLKDVFKTKDLSFISKYTLYKDAKAKVGNLLSVIGYPVLIYFLLSLFIDLPAIYPIYSPSWWMSCIVTGMMLERQLFRSVALYNIYGMRTVFFSVFFPPIFPIRLIWGNIINLEATVRAYIQFFSFKRKKRGKAGQKSEKLKNSAKNTSRRPGKAIAWAKTDHAFLEKSVLRRYRRNLGDVLLQREDISPDVLKQALENKGDELLGSYLVRTGAVTPRQVIIALSIATMTPYSLEPDLNAYPVAETAEALPCPLPEGLPVVPMLTAEGGYVFGCTVDAPLEAVRQLSRTLKSDIYPVYITDEAMAGARALLSGSAPGVPDPLDSPEGELLRGERINYEQYILVRNVCLRLGCTSKEALEKMGLLASAGSAEKSSVTV
ncbi:MAG: glycosyltransferase [Candidatus Limivicinus sp.]